jgi:signal transduction histidine kinase
MTSKKILVIEDVHYLRNDILEMLRLEGYEVAGAENGLIGVQVARDFMPDLIVCDIMMPGLDGYQVLENLRGDQETRTIPFIFLTAKTDRPDVRRGMGLGADDYITKPFYTAELLETIQARLTNRQNFDRMAEEKMDALRENIARSLPHELRTPLNTIIGFSDMLMLEAQSITPEVLLEWAEHINAAGLRLYHLIENYIAYVRVEAIARTPSYLDAARAKVTVNPGGTVEFQAINRAQQHERPTDLKLELNARSSAAIAEDDLTKLVDELVDNAFKFSAKGQEVRVETHDEPGRFVLMVSDHGRGMSADQIANIGAYVQFERLFYEQQGAGLGLIIAKRITEIYNGVFEINSQANTQTTVTVKLPAVS